MSRFRSPLLVAAAFLVLPVASSYAAAGGGSGGFGGGRGGGGGGGKAFVFYFLFTHPILLAAVAIVIGGVAFFGWVRSARYRARRSERVRRVELAAAEAAEDDAAFDVDVVRRQGELLFREIQAAWDARDRERLAHLVGEDLMVEWRRRLSHFEHKGWHNRVGIFAGPTVEYIGLVNREDDRDDRVVVRVEATLQDIVRDRQGRRIKRSDSESDNRVLAEYWTLRKREDDGGWMLLSIEQRAEGDHQLSEPLVPTPWADTERLRDEAVVEGAVAEQLPAGTNVSEVASIGYEGDARSQALDLSLADGRFAPDVLEVAVRRALAAWAEAVDGSDRELSALASPEAIRELLHPDGDRTRVVVRALKVLTIDIVGLDASPDPPRMSAAIVVEGRRYVENRDTADVISGSQSAAARFTEQWIFALDGADANPWRLVERGGRQPGGGAAQVGRRESRPAQSR